jgi:competence protein ComEA
LGALVAASWLGAASLGRAQPASHSGTAVTAPVKPAATGVVNLNEAGTDELERLPGIGPAKARAIVEHRHAHPFHKVDEIIKVKGIGRKTFGKLRPYLTVAGPTTLKEVPRN